MDKELILKKIDELQRIFEEMQKKRTQYVQEINKIDQDALIIKGQFDAYNSILQEMNAASPFEAEKTENE